MHTPPVSVIIPAYDSDMLIVPTLRSVVTQTLKGFELIVVDDGSTDGTAETTDRYLSEHQGDFSYRILRSEKNFGVSHARNVGIRESHGDYLYFLDSDDRILPHGLETLHTGAVVHNAEIALCRFERIKTDGGDVRKLRRREAYGDSSKAILSGQDALLRHLSGTLTLHCGIMLFSRKLILDNSIYFSEDMMCNEDIEFWIKTILNAKRIMYNNKILFSYVIRTGSLSCKSILDSTALNGLKWFERIGLYLREHKAPRDIIRIIEHSYIPMHISRRSRWNAASCPYNRNTARVLCSLARRYPFQITQINAKQLYYWIDNRIMASSPILYKIWHRISMNLIAVSNRLFYIPKWTREFGSL